MSTQGWIGVDLDGTLAFYDHWRGESHVGAPVPAMMERVKRWLAEGQTVKIFTARVAGEKDNRDYCTKVIQDWCEANGLPRLEVTNVKDYQMVQLWDDRAVQIIPNTGMRADSAVVRA